jgi:hypothetical protein
MKATLDFDSPEDRMHAALYDIRQYVDDMYRSDEISEIIRSTILDIIGDLL